jgi:hypothetical protein
MRIERAKDGEFIGSQIGDEPRQRCPRHKE